jgi:hypothetical protein
MLRGVEQAGRVTGTINRIRSHTMYTHLVTIVRNLPRLGRVVQTYQTTADAVQLHIKSNNRRLLDGRIVAFSVTPI